MPTELRQHAAVVREWVHVVDGDGFSSSGKALLNLRKLKVANDRFQGCLNPEYRVTGRFCLFRRTVFVELERRSRCRRLVGLGVGQVVTVDVTTI